MWKFVRGGQLGYKFRRQFDIHSFIVDFYCHQLKLVIELDGWTHDFEKTQKRDGVKQKVLEQAGCKVVRITNEQVFGDMEILSSELLTQCKLREVELQNRPT